MKTNSLKILLIEDNLGDQSLVSDYLHEEFPRLELDFAVNFKEARSLLTQAVSYKIIILDLRLPDIDPDALLKEIIVLAPKNPIIILTGQDDIHTAIKALTLGCTDYLLKDEITSKGLRKSITYAFERKHIDKQLELSVKRYQQLFQLNPQPIWVISNQGGNFLEVNDAAIKIYGFSKDEFLKMRIQDIDLDYKKEHLLQDLEQNEGLNTGSLHQHQLKNGTIIQVKIFGNFIEYQGIESVLLMPIDLSQTESYITKIESQNKQLQEIAWEQSHLVREPLTRMMGIINRMEKKHILQFTNGNEEFPLLLKHLLHSAHEIDDTIRSIVKKSDPENK